MNTKTISSCAILLIIYSLSNLHAQVVAYPGQNNGFSAKSDKFLITLYKTPTDTNGYNSYVYESDAGKDNRRETGGQAGKTFNYTVFSFSGSVTVEVTKLNSNANAAILKPYQLNLSKVKTVESTLGKKIRFTLNNPAKVSVEFDDDQALNNALMIFANKLEKSTDIPNKNAATVSVIKTASDISKIDSTKKIVFFEPGVFQIGYWSIPKSIQQVYISGGAFVRGYLFATRNKGAALKINGRGIISNDVYPYHYPEQDEQNMSSSKGWYKTIQINGGKNNLIEGLTLVDGSAYNILLNADSSIIDNVNIHGFRYNNDGITKTGNSLVIKNCFFHLNEDAIIVYGNSLEVYKTVFWQLNNGSLIQLGWRPHKISGTNIIDSCIIMHADWGERNDNGGFISALNSVPAIDTSKGVENFTIKNIYVETPVQKFLDIRMNNAVSKQNNWFKNFTFENIYFTNNPFSKNSLIHLSNRDVNNKIENFSFKNVCIQGKPADRTFLKNNNFVNTNQ